jgi:hypothetical protein
MLYRLYNKIIQSIERNKNSAEQSAEFFYNNLDWVNYGSEVITQTCETPILTGLIIHNIVNL